MEIPRTWGPGKPQTPTRHFQLTTNLREDLCGLNFPLTDRENEQANVRTSEDLSLGDALAVKGQPGLFQAQLSVEEAG